MAETAVAPRAWRVVLERIEADLLSGRLGPGEHLPPERELAAQLGVGRSSVREALRVLEVMGLIRTGTGSGPTSGAIIIARPQGGMSALLRLQVAAQGFPIDDIVHARLLLETSVAESLAHTHAGDAEGLAEVADVLDAMDASELTPAEFLALDAQLHLALAEASGNTVVAAMMGGLRESIERYVLERAVGIDDWDATAQRLRVEHRALVAAISSGDAEGARARIRDHIIGYYAR